MFILHTFPLNFYPQAMKTGTTIAGIVFKDGVVLGADTRATGGTEVADKNCEKIHYLAPNIYCCGAGTAADTEKTTELIRWGRESEPRDLIFMGCTLCEHVPVRVPRLHKGHVTIACLGRELRRLKRARALDVNVCSSQLELLRLNTGSPSRVITACTVLKRMLFRYQGHISAALVLGGVDATGAHLYQVRCQAIASFAQTTTPCLPCTVIIYT